MYSNNNKSDVFFYLLFLQTVAQSPLQSKEQKHSQNKRTVHTQARTHAHTQHTHTHTHTHAHAHTHYHSVGYLEEKWDFGVDLKEV